MHPRLLVSFTCTALLVVQEVWVVAAVAADVIVMKNVKTTKMLLPTTHECARLSSQLRALPGMKPDVRLHCSDLKLMTVCSEGEHS